MFWFRELLTNNCIQPRAAIEIEGRTKTFQSMGPLNVSFVKSAGLLRRIYDVTFYFNIIVKLSNLVNLITNNDWWILLNLKQY